MWRREKRRKRRRRAQRNRRGKKTGRKGKSEFEMKGTKEEGETKTTLRFHCF